MNEDELKILAMDIVEGKVFTDRFLNDISELPMVFQVLKLMSKDSLIELEELEPQLFYEYYGKGLVRSINEFPCFLTFHFLNKFEATMLFSFIKEYIKLKDNLLNTSKEEDI